MTTTRSSSRARTATEKAAWAFYLIAAGGSTIGQIWVGVDTAPWPTAFPWWVRAVLVAPFAIVVDLGGVVTAAFADARQRLGETAYGWRILSAASVTVGVAINVIGHRDVPYLAVVFGGLGGFAYAVWLGHSAARRRDALRAAGKLADTPPDFGWTQRRREPEATRRARALALEHGYGVHESLALARGQLRDEQRLAAMSRHVERLIRARHEDPILAAIAVTTLDLDAVAAALRAQADVTGWARAIGVNLVPPTVDDAPAAAPPTGDDLALPAAEVVPADVLRRVPAKQADYDRWRQLWSDLATEPDSAAFAARHGISVRQVQWIRAVGATGLLDSPVPPAARLVQIAQRARDNGRSPSDPHSGS